MKNNLKGKVYIVHSRKVDFKEEIYRPIREDVLLNEKFDIFLPHETDTFIDSKEIIKNSDYVVAFIGETSIGMGIELGWADSFNKKIILLSNKFVKSASINTLSERIYIYEHKEAMVELLKGLLD